MYMYSHGYTNLNKPSYKIDDFTFKTKFMIANVTKKKTQKLDNNCTPVLIYNLPYVIIV